MTKIIICHKVRNKFQPCQLIFLFVSRPPFIHLKKSYFLFLNNIIVYIFTKKEEITKKRFVNLELFKSINFINSLFLFLVSNLYLIWECKNDFEGKDCKIQFISISCYFSSAWATNTIEKRSLLQKVKTKIKNM